MLCSEPVATLCMDTAKMIALSCCGLSCERDGFSGGRAAVRDLDIEFQDGALHGVAGLPGSGRSLLLQLLGLLERPDAGEILLCGQRMAGASETTLRSLRNSMFGYLFSAPCLLSGLTASENVAVPYFRFSQAGVDETLSRTREVLQFVGLGAREHLKPEELDLEDQHRLAFARALVHRPKLLLAVSPPPVALLAIARRAVDELGVTCIWTHEQAILDPYCDRIIELRKGRIAADHLFTK